MIDLKNIGATIIGTNPGTPISCFGNCVLQKKLNDMNLIVYGSTTYWFYDENLKCHGIRKENWDKAIMERPDLLAQVYFNVDEMIELTIDDYINKSDSVLEYAILKVNKNRK